MIQIYHTVNKINMLYHVFKDKQFNGYCTNSNNYKSASSYVGS